MTSPLIDTRTDQGFINVAGNIVEKRMHDIVEKIKDYDSNLELLCVDPSRSLDMFEAPFVLGEVINTPQGLQFFKIFEFWHLDESILERIYLCDTKRHDVLAAMDANNMAIRLETERRYREQMEEAKDVTKFIADHLEKQSSASWTRPEDGAKVTFYEDRPAKVERPE